MDVVEQKTSDLTSVIEILAKAEQNNKGQLSNIPSDQECSQAPVIVTMPFLSLNVIIPLPLKPSPF